jgi:hypothetical protein
MPVVTQALETAGEEIAVTIEQVGAELVDNYQRHERRPASD